MLDVREWDPETELSFVTSSWLRSYRDSRFIGVLCPRAYWVAYQTTLEEILPRCRVLVITPTEEPTQILGYCASEVYRGVPCVHYVYVKQDLRRQGLATALLEHSLPPGCKGFMHTFRNARTEYFKNRYYLTWSPKVVTETQRETSKAD